MNDQFWYGIIIPNDYNEINDELGRREMEMWHRCDLPLTSSKPTTWNGLTIVLGSNVPFTGIPFSF